MQVYLPQFSIGEDVFLQLEAKVKDYGDNIVIIHGERAWKAASRYIMPVLEKSALNVLTLVSFGKETSLKNAVKLAELPDVKKADAILAVGGGKCIDTAKKAADIAGKPIFTIPTIASNCAPVTKISVMYNDDGTFAGVDFLKNTPAHCFINPKIICEAPAKYFWAGIGDAMAKNIESEWSAKNDDNLDWGSQFGILAGQMCFTPLINSAIKAFEDFKNIVVSKELLETMTNVIISPGIVSVTVHPNYNGGIAHALFYGLTCRKHIELNHLHGEVVSYGSLVNLIVDENWEKLKIAYLFNQNLGLPTCLADLEIETDDLMEDILSATMQNQELSHTPYPVDEEMIRKGILDLEQYCPLMQ